MSRESVAQAELDKAEYRLRWAKEEFNKVADFMTITLVGFLVECNKETKNSKKWTCKT